MTKHIRKTCAPFNLGVHCVSQKTNLDVQTLSSFPLVYRMETLLQSLYQYFCKSSKHHLEFSKLATIVETKGSKLLRNVKTKWISMLSLAKWVMAKYKTLLMKMAINMDANSQATTNFELVVDLDMLLSLLCILMLLEFVHSLIIFFQRNDFFFWQFCECGENLLGTNIFLICSSYHKVSGGCIQGISFLVGLCL